MSSEDSTPGRTTPPAPPRPVIEPAVKALVKRLAAAEHQGFSVRTIAVAAGMSEKALATYDSKFWNPTKTTLVAVELALARLAKKHKLEL